MYTANAEVLDVDSLRLRSRQQPLRHFRSESVVAEEDVADPGDEHLGHLTTSSSSGWKNSPRRCQARTSVAGSSSTVTCTSTLSSTSVKMPGTVARWPARNMSCASARRFGRRMTADPFDTSAPLMISVSAY